MRRDGEVAFLFIESLRELVSHRKISFYRIQKQGGRNWNFETGILKEARACVGGRGQVKCKKERRWSGGRDCKVGKKWERDN